MTLVVEQLLPNKRLAGLLDRREDLIAVAMPEHEDNQQVATRPRNKTLPNRTEAILPPVSAPLEYQPQVPPLASAGNRLVAWHWVP